MGEQRFGLGFDVHPRVAGRDLRLAGVFFEHESGLAGHSDGDVVCHSVADALFGAAALGDVGTYFPEDDPSTAGIPGLELLARAVDVVCGGRHKAVACDATVICDRPAIGPRRDELRANLARALGVSIDRVSVKATRPEGLGLTGDGIGCLAIATIA